jgi:thiol-disulfide isomerase/thioredoxin
MRQNQKSALIAATLLTCLTLGLGQASAEDKGPIQGPVPPSAAEPAPTFEFDKKNKAKRDHINFALNPKPISDAKMKFSHFANRKLVIFYFSAKCPHCQHAFPHVQRVSDELASQGFAAIAIAIKYNSEDDIRGFIRDYKVHIPVFQDEDRSFGENYGTGSIPLVIMVNDKGEYIRYKTFDAAQTPAMMKTSANQLAAK